MNHPIPLGSSEALPRFPVSALPDPIRSMVASVAEFTQTDPAMAGTVALGVLSACAAGRASVEVRGSWTEPLCLFLAVSSAPGTRKSPVYSLMTSPLVEAERSLLEKWRPEALEKETEKRVATDAARKAEQAAATADTEAKRAQLTKNAVAAAMLAEGIEKPVQPRIMADDVTPEALAGLLASHGGRIALMSSEGGLFDTLAGRYSSGIPNLDTFLKGWSAEPVRVDRRGGTSEYVPHAHVTVTLTIQPSVLTAIARNGVFRGRGLLARFLFALPPNNVGRRRVGTDPVDRELHETYDDWIRILATALEQWASDPAKLLLSPDAAKLLLEYEYRLEPRLGPNGDLHVVADWASKASGQAVRIAGLLHLAEGGTSAIFCPITGETMTAALELMDYFTAHAKAAFVAMGTDEATLDARYVLEHLRREGMSDFTIRDLHVKLGSNRFPKVDDLKAALDVLEDHHWIAAQPAPDHPGPGRKPSPRYTVTEITQSTESTQSSVDCVGSVSSATVRRSS